MTSTKGFLQCDRVLMHMCILRWNAAYVTFRPKMLPLPVALACQHWQQGHNMIYKTVYGKRYSYAIQQCTKQKTNILYIAHSSILHMHIAICVSHSTQWFSCVQVVTITVAFTFELHSPAGYTSMLWLYFFRHFLALYNLWFVTVEASAR